MAVYFATGTGVVGFGGSVFFATLCFLRRSDGVFASVKNVSCTVKLCFLRRRGLFCGRKQGVIATSAWIHCTTVGKRNAFTSVSFSLGCKEDFIVRSKLR